jgi:hypothetical protein
MAEVWAGTASGCHGSARTIYTGSMAWKNMTLRCSKSYPTNRLQGMQAGLSEYSVLALLCGKQLEITSRSSGSAMLAGNDGVLIAGPIKMVICGKSQNVRMPRSCYTECRRRFRDGLITSSGAGSIEIVEGTSIVQLPAFLFHLACSPMVNFFVQGRIEYHKPGSGAPIRIVPHNARFCFD